MFQSTQQQTHIADVGVSVAVPPDIAMLRALLQHELGPVLHQLEDIKLDIASIKKTIRLAYCRHWSAAHLVNDIDTCASLLACSNLTSTSMMSVAEIVADYQVNDRGCCLVGQNGGDCLYAATTAFTFFEHTYALMRPRIVSCVLLSPSNAPLLMGDGIMCVPEAAGDISADATAYQLMPGTCVWLNDGSSPHPGSVTGYKHYAISVQTLGGEIVMVDWGISQFSHVPDDMRLYLV